MRQPPSAYQIRGAGLWLFLINVILLIVFAWLSFVRPVQTRFSVISNFTELDRAGVINAKALSQFPASRGLGYANSLEYRLTVPGFIAQAPLGAERGNAMLGLIVTAGNAIFWFAFWRWTLSLPTQEGAEAILKEGRESS